MSRRIGDPIDLDTTNGLVTLRHVRVDDKEGVSLIGKKQLSTVVPFPLRVQSSCLFGESFWSTDCDCAWQLQESLSRIIEHGGMLIYFYEEGRGAGLEKKIEAIRLQQTANMTTTEAYACLQLEPDVRNYRAVRFVVDEVLGEGRLVKLFTNDPRKERLIRDAGVNVVKREPLVYNQRSPAIIRYLKDKSRLLGHVIDFDDVSE